MEQPRLIPINLDNYKPLREIVFESLREAIILGRLKPGERLMEIQLAEEMGVSRTPSSEEDIDSIVEGDTSFHDLIYRASRNQRLVQIVTHLQEQIQRFRMTSLSQPGRIKIALDEHKKIVEAISDRNVELAQALASEHIENAEQSLLNALREEKFNG